MPSPSSSASGSEERQGNLRQDEPFFIKKKEIHTCQSESSYMHHLLEDSIIIRFLKLFLMGRQSGGSKIQFLGPQLVLPPLSSLFLLVPPLHLYVEFVGGLGGGGIQPPCPHGGFAPGVGAECSPDTN
jgi:hypothetical protein